jgi:hypothetical protein
MKELLANTQLFSTEYVGQRLLPAASNLEQGGSFPGSGPFVSVFDFTASRLDFGWI